MKIERSKSLKALNTFGIDAAAKYFTEICSPGKFNELADEGLPQFQIF